MIHIWLDEFFHIRERGSTVITELFAGLTTFLTVAYILALNPAILSDAGLLRQDVLMATILVSAIACLTMGLYANKPYAVCPSMMLNTFLATNIVLILGLSWQIALTAVFVASILFALLILVGLRTFLLEAIPPVIKIACMSGVGLFLILIGLSKALIIEVDVDELNLISMGYLTKFGDLIHLRVLLSIVGVLLISVLVIRKVRGALLIGIIIIALLGWITGIEKLPHFMMALPTAITKTAFQFDFSQCLTLHFVVSVITLLYIMSLESIGVMTGLDRFGGQTDPEGHMFGSNPALLTHAGASIFGSLLGTSPLTTAIESASGIQDGGRTGLTTVVVGVLFIFALLFTPFFAAIPNSATAPALIVIGIVMMRGITDLSWDNLEDIIPVFLTIAVMALTYSVVHGISFGIISYVIIYMALGRRREIHPLMYVLAVFAASFFVIEDLYYFDPR